MTASFDRYAIVDWSSAATPTTGKDSIWISFAARDDGEARIVETINPPTRSAAMAELRRFLREAVAENKRVFCGFDFPFGYPAGTAQRIAGTPDWSALWGVIHERIIDRDDNFNNRFEVAGRMNREELADAPMFWARPTSQVIPGLQPTKPVPYPTLLDEFRVCEKRAQPAQPVWKLTYAGSVGGQTLTGMARLEGLRRDEEFAEHLAVWPFETDFSEKLEDKPIVLAEIYPSMFRIERGEKSCLDEAQVETLALHFARLDAKGGFSTLLSVPNDRMSEREAHAVMREEGWIVGLGHPLGLGQPAQMGGGAEAGASGLSIGPAMPSYLKDMAAIEAETRRLALAEADLSQLPESARDFALRLVEAGAAPEILADLVLSDGALAAGRAALDRGASILCDTEMVAHGIASRDLPHANRIVCRLADPRVARIAEREATTRFAAQVDLWNDQLEGAIVAIGEAPTALFRLLERLDGGAPRPALILAFPFGFVGAAEAKAELARDSRGVPFAALRGRRGGPSFAAAAVNALARDEDGAAPDVSAATDEG